MYDYKQILAENIQQLAKQRGIGKTEACIESGAGKSFISNMIGKDQAPSFDKVLQLAQYFNVSIDYLVGRSEKSTDELVKLSLFGISDVDEETYSQVKQYAKFLIKERSDNMYIPAPNELKDVNISEDCKQRVANGSYLYESEAEEIANALAISKDKIIGNRHIREDRKPIAKIEDVDDYSQKSTAARGDYSTSEKPNAEKLSNIPTMDNE